MKKLILCCFVLFTISSQAKVKTDTITNWQIYKDGKAVVFGNITQKAITTIPIDENESIGRLTISLYHESDNYEKINRSIELLDEKGEMLLKYDQLDYSFRPFVIPHQEVITYMKNFRIERLQLQFEDEKLKKPLILACIELRADDQATDY